MAAADRAISEAEALRSRYAQAGRDNMVDLTTRMIDFLVGRRQGALEGTLFDPRGPSAFGVSRFVSDYEWGPEADTFVETAYALERYWIENC